MSKSLKVHLTLFMVGAIYAGNYTIAKEVMPAYVGAFGFILIRVLLASIFFWIIHALFVKEKIQHVNDIWIFLKCSFFGVMANQLLFFKGLSLTVPINAALIMTATPILVFVASAIILKERLTKNKILGLSLGFLGAFLLIGNGRFEVNEASIAGDLMILGNACCYGIYLVMVKPLMQRYHPLTVVKWVFTLAIPMVTLFGFYDISQVQWSEIPFSIYLAISYVVIGVTVMAYLLNAWALKSVNASIVGIYIYVQPVLATLIAVTFGKDEMTITKGIFALLIFTGVYLVSIRK